MANLLLISCSRTKKKNVEAIPALERYDGMIYKVIKKARRERYWPEQTNLYIVSAKYGLISEQTLIKDYDQKMTDARAVELQIVVSQTLDSLLQQNRYVHIFINMGAAYTQNIILSSELLKARHEGRLKEATGGIGERLQQTKAWLLQTTEIQTSLYIEKHKTNSNQNV
jgi:hypothetical protein